MLDGGVTPVDDPRLLSGKHVFLGGEARSTLSSAKRFAPALACQPAPRDPSSPCVATYPEGVPRAPAAILTRGPSAAEHQAHEPSSPSPAPGPDLIGQALVLREGDSIEVVGLDAVGILLTRVLAVPALHDRTRTTEPFVVPANAWLRLSIGIEPAAWHIDAAPVRFRVEMEDETGATQDLFRRVLDPASRPQDRRWFDSGVDLSYVAGAKLRLRFITEPAERDDARPSLPLWGDPRIVAPAADRGPSIVLVSLDTLRAKSMSTYGYALETTPRMSALAAQGAVFENAFTTFSNTLPAHMSMLTGLYPATHGVVSFGQHLAARHPTLAEVLRDAGYGTAAFTEDALLDSRHGFLRGFSTYDENTTIADGAGDAETTFGRALEWAGRHADERFFLFAHTYQVHWPYEPPDAYRSLFTAPDSGHVDDKQRAYDQEIRFTDDVLQRFVDGLRRVLPERDLVLVVTSDHGEEFYDHGLFTHHQLYDEVMRIPLIMVGSGRIPPGERIATPVSLVDVPPTILGLAGVHPPRGLDGTSLLPLLSGQVGDLERAAVFGEFPASSLVAEHHFVARSQHAKCFVGESGGGDVCFDLQSDPDERHPLPGGEASQFAALRARADAYRRRAIAARADADEPPPSTATPRPEHPDAEPEPPEEASPAKPDGTGGADPVARKLRALGYAE